MVSQNGNKFSSSVYELGEKVLVKMKISDKKIRGKHKICDIIKGKIVNQKETRYEVNYIDKKGKIDKTAFLDQRLHLWHGQ